MNHRADTDAALLSEIRDDLRRREAEFDVPAGDVVALAMAGARRRRLRLRAGVAAALVLAAVGVAAVVGLPTGADAPVVAEQSPDAPPFETSSPMPEDRSPVERSTSGTSSTSPTDAPSTTTTPTGTDSDPSTLLDAPLVVATEEGVVRRQGGRTMQVPGIDTPVDVAFDDGAGGVVFQRNANGIGLLRDGEISTLVAIAEYGSRSFPALVGDDRILEPVGIDLRDVDASAGRMAFTVTWGALRGGDGEDGDPAFVSVVVTAALDGTDRLEVDATPAYEAGYLDVAVAGDEVVVHPASFFTGGRYEIARDGAAPRALDGLQHAGEGANSETVTAFIDGAGVDEGRLAVVERTINQPEGEGELVVYDMESGESLSTRTLTRPGPAGRPVALAQSLVLLVETLPDGQARSWLLDLDTGESQEFPGRASMVG